MSRTSYIIIKKINNVTVRQRHGLIGTVEGLSSSAAINLILFTLVLHCKVLVKETAGLMPYVKIGK